MGFAEDESYFKRDVLATHPDLEFLSSILVLLWPLRIIFPVEVVSGLIMYLNLRT